MRSKITVLLLLSLIIISCGSSKEGYRQGSQRNSRIIFEEEIQGAHSVNALDLVQKLRPHWLRPRGRRSVNNHYANVPWVYVNGIRQGTAEVLSSLSVENLTELEYLTGSDATTRFGMNHSAGAILITYFY